MAVKAYHERNQKERNNCIINLKLMRPYLVQKEECSSTNTHSNQLILKDSILFRWFVKYFNCDEGNDNSANEPMVVSQWQ
jgi:hypothetical protein